MIDRKSPLAQAYLFRRRGFDARLSLIMARQDLAAGIKRYAPAANWRAMAGGNWQRLADMPRYRSPTDRAYFCDEWPSGWRLVGRADSIGDRPRAVDHSGWYTEDDGDSGTLTGYVLQIPARDGVAQYVPGTRHSDQDGVTLYPLDRCDDATECARAADRYAEIAAESERDYQRASSAGFRASELNEESIAARREILTICRDLRIARKALKPRILPQRDNVNGAIVRLCAIARGEVNSLLRAMRKARIERDKLVDNYGNDSAFREEFPLEN